MMKLWGGRFESEPSEVFERFSQSLGFDRRLLEADLRGSQAWVRALERVGILTAQEREALLAGLEAIRAEAERPDFFEGARDEDVHTLVIRKLRERAGPAAEKIHTGRSRNEQVSLDVRLWLRERIDAVRRAICELAGALVEAARARPEAIVPGYTHLRRAQAVPWAHYLLAYFEMLARDWERFGQARARANLLPLGSGALAGSGFPFDREELARELGFEGLTRNSMDAAADRDFILDFLYAASVTMVHLSRLAEDWILYSSEEFGWLELGDEVTSGSSLMPQKKNPDALELIRGKCGRVFGCLVSLLVTMKGLPMTYNRDMQEDKPPLFDAFDTVKSSLELAAPLVSKTVLNRDAIADRLDRGHLDATTLMEHLIQRGVPQRTAHGMVGGLVRLAIERGCRLADLPVQEFRQACAELGEEVYGVLGPKRAVEAMQSYGSTGPDQVRRQIETWRKRIHD